MGEAIGGDQDDWAVDILGIPSATAEIGVESQFKDSWRASSIGDASSILHEQSHWI